MSGETRVKSREQAGDVEQHYTGGQHAALRGCWRVLCNAPTWQDHVAWYAGYDSVPRELRGSAPLTGPIPKGVFDRLGGV